MKQQEQQHEYEQQQKPSEFRIKSQKSHLEV